MSNNRTVEEFRCFNGSDNVKISGDIADVLRRLVHVEKNKRPARELVVEADDASSFVRPSIKKFSADYVQITIGGVDLDFYGGEPDAHVQEEADAALSSMPPTEMRTFLAGAFEKGLERQKRAFVHNGNKTDELRKIFLGYCHAAMICVENCGDLEIAEGITKDLSAKLEELTEWIYSKDKPYDAFILSAQAATESAQYPQAIHAGLKDDVIVKLYEHNLIAAIYEDLATTLEPDLIQALKFDLPARKAELAEKLQAILAEGKALKTPAEIEAEITTLHKSGQFAQPGSDARPDGSPLARAKVAAQGLKQRYKEWAGRRDAAAAQVSELAEEISKNGLRLEGLIKNVLGQVAETLLNLENQETIAQGSIEVTFRAYLKNLHEAVPPDPISKRRCDAAIQIFDVLLQPENLAKVTDIINQVNASRKITHTPSDNFVQVAVNEAARYRSAIEIKYYPDAINVPGGMYAFLEPGKAAGFTGPRDNIFVQIRNRNAQTPTLVLAANANSNTSGNISTIIEDYGLQKLGTNKQCAQLPPSAFEVTIAGLPYDVEYAIAAHQEYLARSALSPEEHKALDESEGKMTADAMSAALSVAMLRDVLNICAKKGYTVGWTCLGDKKVGEGFTIFREGSQNLITGRAPELAHPLHRLKVLEPHGEITEARIELSRSVHPHPIKKERPEIVFSMLEHYVSFVESGRYEQIWPQLIYSYGEFSPLPVPASFLMRMIDNLEERRISGVVAHIGNAVTRDYHDTTADGVCFRGMDLLLRTMAAECFYPGSTPGEVSIAVEKASKKYEIPEAEMAEMVGNCLKNLSSIPIPFVFGPSPESETFYNTSIKPLLGRLVSEEAGGALLQMNRGRPALDLSAIRNMNDTLLVEAGMILAPTSRVSHQRKGYKIVGGKEPIVAPKESAPSSMLADLTESATRHRIISQSLAAESKSHFVGHNNEIAAVVAKIDAVLQEGNSLLPGAVSEEIVHEPYADNGGQVSELSSNASIFSAKIKPGNRPMEGKMRPDVLAGGASSLLKRD